MRDGAREEGCWKEGRVVGKDGEDEGGGEGGVEVVEGVEEEEEEQDEVVVVVEEEEVCGVGKERGAVPIAWMCGNDGVVDDKDCEEGTVELIAFTVENAGESDAFVVASES